MGICVKDENIKYLKSRRYLLEKEMKSIIMSKENDNDYYNKLSDTINKIDLYLEDEKEYIHSKLFRDINLTREYIKCYTNWFDEDELVNNIIPYLKGKLNSYQREKENLIDPDFKKVYFDKNGYYSIGLKHDEDLELYNELEIIIKEIDDFLELYKDLIRNEMYTTIKIVDEVIHSMERTI